MKTGDVLLLLLGAAGLIVLWRSTMSSPVMQSYPNQLTAAKRGVESYSGLLAAALKATKKASGSNGIGNTDVVSVLDWFNTPAYSDTVRVVPGDMTFSGEDITLEPGQLYT